VPLVLGLTLLWQVVSSLSHTDVGVHQAASVGQVSLEPDAAGARVDVVLVDRVGQEATLSGDLTFKVRDPDGAVWQTTRSVSAGDFRALPDGSLLAGRTGYSLIVPTSDWVRPPRRGGLATISVMVTPSNDGPSFSTQLQQRFP
jgi:hypothetical protein